MVCEISEEVGETAFVKIIYSVDVVTKNKKNKNKKIK